MPLVGPRRTSHYQMDCWNQDTYISRSCTLWDTKWKVHPFGTSQWGPQAQDAEFAKIVPSSKVGAVRTGIFGCMKLYVVVYIVRIIANQMANFIVNSRVIHSRHIWVNLGLISIWISIWFQKQLATACGQSFKLKLCHHTKEARKIPMTQANYGLL